RYSRDLDHDARACVAGPARQVAWIGKRERHDGGSRRERVVKCFGDEILRDVVDREGPTGCLLVAVRINWRNAAILSLSEDKRTWRGHCKSVVPDPFGHSVSQLVALHSFGSNA
ncbi:MAG: hypothetical protein WAN65_13270, partial [Candidatus Sulfotelmatobacter sp.]